MNILSTRSSRYLAVLATVGLVAFNADASSWFYEMIRPPVDISENGHLIDELFDFTTNLNLFFFTLVCLGLFGFSWFYHGKRHPKAIYTHGTSRKQGWIAVGTGILVFVAIDLNITGMSNDHLIKVFMNFPDESKEDVVRVEVMAQQWLWNIRYPGKDKIFNTDDDIVTNNDLRVPIGKKVVFQFISKDVIHAFYLPNARRKVDVIPGRITRMWVKTLKTGEYDIACAEMCGTHHYLMKAKLTVYTPEEYENWLEEAHQVALTTNDPENLDSYWGWKWEKNIKE